MARLPVRRQPARHARQYDRDMRPVIASIMGAAAALSAVLTVDAVRTDAWTASGMALSAPGAIGLVADGHDYYVPSDVAWTDLQGGYHSSGRPDCLPPTGKQEGPVTVRALKVEAEGYTRRQVVHVRCMESNASQVVAAVTRK